MTKPKKLFIRIVTAAFLVAVIIACIYIMVRRIGLSDSLDFGAGAYYYADIPDFDKTFPLEGAFKPALPYFVYVLIFLAWGALMYLLWKWVDKR